NAVAPVAEAFAIVALFREACEHGAEFVFDLRIFDRVFPDAIEARAGGVAAEPELIAAGRFADESDFRHVSARATVRAAGRTNDDFLVGQTEIAAEFFDTVDQTGQHALGFREREAAGWQSRAGHRS